MKLKDWMKQKNLTYRAFAKTLGVAHMTVWGVANGTYQPSLKLARCIEEATDFEVLVWDLMPERGEKEEREEREEVAA